MCTKLLKKLRLSNIYKYIILIIYIKTHILPFIDITTIFVS